MKIDQVLALVPADGLRALLAQLPEDVLRRAVAAAVEAPDAATVTPTAVATVEASGKKVKAGAPAAPATPAPAPKAPAAPAPAPKAPAAPGPFDAAIAQLAPYGFAAGDLATACGTVSQDPKLRGAIQRALKAGTLFGAGEKRYARYGATPAIAQARSDKDRAG